MVDRMEDLFAMAKRAQNAKKTLLENLGQKGDIGIKLETIFNDVAQKYGVLMAERRAMIESQRNRPAEADNVVLHPRTADLEAFRQKALEYVRDLPDTPEGLVGLFQKGRALDEACMVSPTTEVYIVARNAVDAVLKERGFDIKVR